MLPISIKIQNFMSYGEREESLDFNKFKIASLTGPNGAGKSSLLEAITWALWGQARAKDEANLIHTGQNEMQVELDFVVNEEKFRVFRKKSAKKSLLHLEHEERGEFFDITEDTTRNTQEKLTSDILKMPYEVFINSAFLRQGKADEFTVKSPVERKKILGDILGLDYYEKLVEQIRKKLRELKIQQESLKHILEKTKLDLSQEAECEAEGKKLNLEIKKLTEQKEKLEKDLDKFQEQQKKLLTESEVLKEKKHRLDNLAEEIAENQGRALKLRDNLQKYQMIIKEAPAIEEGYKQWTEAEKKNEELTNKSEKQRQLDNKLSEIEERINAEKNKLELERAKLETEINQIKTEQQDEEQLQKSLSQTKSELVKIEKIKEEKRLLEKDIYQIKEKIAGLKSRNQTIYEQANENKKKLAQIKEAGTNCPLCQQKLTDQHRKDISQKIEIEVGAKRVIWLENEKEIKLGKDAIAQNEAKLNELERTLIGESAIEQKIGEVEMRLKQIETKRATFKELNEKFQKLTYELNQKTFSPLDQEILAKTEAELKKIEYNPSVHQKIRDDLNKLKHFSDQKHHLDNARENHEQQNEELETLENKIKREQEEQNNLQKEQEKSTSNLKDLSQVNNLVLDLKKEQTKFNGLLQEKQHEFSLVQAKLDQCAKIKNEIKDYEKKAKQLKENSNNLTTLEHAFGKDGIQAMIIENAIPEIETEANLILDRMTGGEMHVELETQKEKKTGGSKESLEIKITDKLGPRLYELFSGGEAFRINFAIRIALSKLLSKRANAKLQFLVIDEGFGTQDNAGRENLILAINSIRNDFGRILVISHLDGVKEEFPTHIEVTKDDIGSHIELKE